MIWKGKEVLHLVLMKDPFLRIAKGLKKIEFRKKYNDILGKYVETYDAIGEYEDRLNRDAERRMMEERESRAGF